eukprot:scaffold1071_cov166-Amphora_coffeaeformis.AAC.2
MNHSVRTSFNGCQTGEKRNGVHNRPLSFKSSRSQNPRRCRMYNEHIKEETGQAGKVLASSICAFAHVVVVAAVVVVV